MAQRTHHHPHHHHSSSPASPPSTKTLIEVDGIQIDLRNRALAALLAWLIPGAGHFYQGRRAKGILFGVTILITFFVGFSIGGGHVVYASWVPGDKRWHFACQLGAGVVTFPALVEGYQMKKFTLYRDGVPVTADGYKPFFQSWGGWMAPPRRPVSEDRPDDVAAWYARRGAGYEMGTWYTMIAGLLNILVIYDAYSGPLSTPISGRKKESEGDEAAEADATSGNEG